ncbi:Flagellar hook-length control protein FliK [Levilactobacillus brevis]|nr:Flagellar hook-length control protein FliK [Levilactobacillus brevis]
MQKSLKNSLYLGLAVLSLGTVTVVSTTANAAAKTKVTSDVTLKTAAESRNVEATGTNALYSKPGTVKGAKLVASKTTMKKMANSKKSADYFRAYRVAKTTRGTVYYKMVSMDGKYRGYVYGGRSVKAFAGGIKKAATTKSATMPSNTTMYFKTPGKSNVSWTAPNNTQYKASKVVKDTTTYANDALVVTDAARKTREGSLYYYVTDAAHPEVNGWVYAKGLTTTKPTTDNFNDKTDVKVNLKNADGVVIKTAILSKLDANGGTTSTATGTAVGDSAKKQANDAWGKTVLTGTGYKYV